MLVRFTVENCLSFRERVELSMVASKKVQAHPEHVVRPARSEGPSLLKLAVIYGANASGKSNLVKAMDISRRLILNAPKADQPIDRRPFKLDKECRKRPSRFEFEIKLKDRYYAYGFAVSSERVVEEWLFEVARRQERRLFERRQGKIELGHLPSESDSEKAFLEFTAKGTLPNRFFLTECRERNVRHEVRGAQELIDAIDWFYSVPFFILPESKFESLALGVHSNPFFKDELARLLRCFDTGIEALELQKMEYEQVDIPPDFRAHVEAEIDRAGSVTAEGSDGSVWLYERDDRGQVRSWKLTTRHGRADGSGRPVAFEINEESDGTRRLMNLLPAFMILMSADVVGVIDELDRSVHPDVLHSCLANFLQYSTARSSQLIVTTHDTTLLKQPFLRRDEVWFVEKGPDQTSRLFALEEFKDADRVEDWQQGYLQGRFGGVPVLRDFSWLGTVDGKRA
jgi:AAA15 family ATPase/GTPase